jgi:very-short-patch-repair endonuclease
MLERAQQLRINTNPSEERMWSIVRARRLAGLKFRRQHVIGAYIADFVCLPAKLVIEVDGDSHGSDEAELKDAKRTDEIERTGYRVIRFWSNDVLSDRDGGIEDVILEALMASALPTAEKSRLRAEGYVSSSAISSLSTPLT